jgi:predicted metal-dependent hydrolase
MRIDRQDLRHALNYSGILSAMQLGLPFLPPGPSPPALSHLQFLFVRNRRARRYLVRVDPEGFVRVTIPRGGSKRAAGEFASQHLAWIHRQRARLLSAPRVAIGDVERRAFRATAAMTLPVRLHQLADAHGLRVSRVSVRNQRSRWGSCGRDGHICLNWRLVLMPEWVRDYVIVHELMHLRRLDHSPRFWALVRTACPDYVSARRWLRQHGPSLR